MIPKVIHYCWFGGKPLSQLAEECIASWREQMPEYEIKRWDESNFDFSTCEFARKAYENRKWAFVSDYCRAWILYNYGGIYLDTDVKIIKSFDSFLGDGFFLSFEGFDFLEAHVLGCEKGDKFAKNILDSFDKTVFDISSGVSAVCTMPMRITEVFQSKYKIRRFYSRKIVVDGIKIYPRSFFSPIDYMTQKKKITKDTVAVHLYNGSWLDEEHKPVGTFKYKIKEIIKKCLYITVGYETAQKLIHRGRGND